MREQKAVLLVEDDCMLLDLNKRVLEREGYRVLPARNLKEARELADNANPQLIVLDMELPDKSGLDFCRELHETRSIPIVFLTSTDGAECEKSEYATGADETITKPYCIGQLTESVRALVGDKAKEEETP